MTCVKLLFIFQTALMPPAQWKYQLADSMNVILYDNNAGITLIVDEFEGIPVIFKDTSDITGFGLGFTGDKVVMYNQTAGLPYKLLLHEIGHVLGLPHTFGFCAPHEVAETCDDGFSDTPFEAGNSTSRNVMGYNDFQDYFSPMQIEAIKKHLNTDTLYSGLYLPEFGMSIAQFKFDCPADLSVLENEINEPKIIRRIDFSGREVDSDFRGFSIEFYSDNSYRKIYRP